MLRIHAHHLDRLVSAAQEPGVENTPPTVWYDLVSPTVEEEREVGATLGISVPTMDEMEDIELSSRLYQEDGAEFMTMTVLTRPDAGTPRKVPVTFIMVCSVA